MKDLTEYSDNELSLMVFNDEYYYNKRSSRYFIGMLKTAFIFTNAQLAVLRADLKDETC